ncbi:C-reactive protein [Leptonychotes weddellii]|uniref:Pentraxin family member n=1 Tax=Leptonychotes weddellii TaxID=9713 RepID=A0A2U3YE62_LEPWE|nr:C-reactive protein [Leptonychotes weddellii]
MDKLLLCFLVIVNLSGAFFQGDTYRKAFVFPRESDTSFVTLFAPVQKPLSAFTMCLQAYTALSRPYSLFSYATRAQHNEILLFREKFGLYSVSVGGSDIYFKVPETFYTPRHFCVTWESSTGITELWVDGKPMVRMSLKKGYSVGAGASIILGQEQDSFGGGFDTNQSLVGDIGDVNMWDYVLSPHDISTVHAGGVFSPNFLNWQNLNYSTRGEVFLKNQLWS